MNMLSELIREGFGSADREDFSCSEKILHGSNRIYGLGLDRESLKMAAGLSSGIYCERTCGAVTASAMVLAKLFVREKAHEGEYHKGLIAEMVTRCEEAMGTSGCAVLKENFRTEEEGCTSIIVNVAEILDDIIGRELARR